MLKNNRRKLIVSSLIILLPIVFGLVFWNNLPAHMTTHWGVDGTADGWMGKTFAVFALPLLMLAIHWLCIWLTARDHGNRNQNPKILGLMFWIIPFISLFANGIIYTASFGSEPPVMAFVPLLLGLMFVFIGNYMPKCKQNWTIGIKVKWALQNEENWNATHRFAGKVWFAGGLAMLAGAFLPEKVMICVMLPVILVIAVVPAVYSFLYHRKQVREGNASAQPFTYSRNQKNTILISIIGAAAALLFAAVILFTGEINVVFGDDAFTVESSYWNDLTVAYDAVDAIEYREQDQRGTRTSGLGSAKLLAGAFRNDEFGSYTRYSYTRCDACIVLKADGKTLVLNAPDAQATKALYEALQSRIP